MDRTEKIARAIYDVCPWWPGGDEGISPGNPVPFDDAPDFDRNICIDMARAVIAVHGTGRCKDCKHYSEQEGYSGAPAGNALHGTCDHPKFLMGYHHHFKDLAPDGLWIENDEGWGWIVGREFGCIHFEER